jgi:uncharacterized protein DUF6540
MSYNVFLVEYLGVSLNHVGIFVETNGVDESGQLFHVVGNIQTGMTYETRMARKPEDSNTFVSKSNLGWIDAQLFDRVDSICRSIPPPKKQFHGPKKLYPKEPLRRCHEWAHEAIAALRSAGVLQTATLDPVPPNVDEPAEYWAWSDEYGQYYHDNGDGTFEWAQQEQSSASSPKTESKGKGHGKGKGKAKR